MAGDWIKMRADLHTHPKVVRIASALKADRLRTVGGLHAVWCLFDVHSEDGNLSGYTAEALDDLIGWQGFSRALEAVEWLEIGDDYLSLPRFEAHNGQSAKRRAQEADRKRTARESVRNSSASKADTLRTREEKRREEKNSNTPQPPKGGKSKFDPAAIELPDWIDPDAWQAWCEDRKKRRKPITELAAKQQIKQLGDYRADGFTPEEVIANSIAAGYQGLFPPNRRPNSPAAMSKQESLERRNAETAARVLSEMEDSEQ